MIRAVLLLDGRAVGTWKLAGSGRRRRLVVDPFNPPLPDPAPPAVEVELADVARYLDLDLELAS